MKGGSKGGKEIEEIVERRRETRSGGRRVDRRGEGRREEERRGEKGGREEKKGTEK